MRTDWISLFVLLMKVKVSASTSVASACHHYYIGSEFDFVIFSTVRSMPHQTIKNKAAVQADRAWIRENLGFITDRHQICVGITRAKHGLVIVGECIVCTADIICCYIGMYK